MPQGPNDVGEDQYSRNHVHDCHPCLRRRRLRRGIVAEHKGSDDADHERDAERAQVEPEPGAQRPVAEDEREDRERESCRRQHRREADERELDFDRRHEPNLSDPWRPPTHPVRTKKALESLG